ncbi:unnamed protein product, partial [Didymodactylos carnosus]
IEKCDCESVYVGKTDRQATRRFGEHGHISNLLKSSMKEKPPPPTANTLTTTQPVRQSQRQRRKPKLYEFEEEDIPEEGDNVIQTFEQHCDLKSAISVHEREKKHRMNWENWKILAKDSNRYRLKIHESLHIIALKPDLNETVRSVPLVIFPEGQVSLNRKETRKKVKMKGM